MPWIIKNFLCCPDFHNLSRIHNSYTVCHSCYNTKIMADKDGCHLHFFLDSPENIKNLRLNRHIQRSRRFVSKQNLRITGKGNCHNCSLTHTPGKFMRILTDPFFRSVYFHQLHQFYNSFSDLSSRHFFIMDPHRLSDLFSNRDRRIQRCHRILKDHRKKFSTQP